MMFINIRELNFCHLKASYKSLLRFNHCGAPALLSVHLILIECICAVTAYQLQHGILAAPLEKSQTVSVNPDKGVRVTSSSAVITVTTPLLS